MKRGRWGFTVLAAIAFFPCGLFCQSSPPATGETAQKENAEAATTTVAGIVRTAQNVPVPGAGVRVVHLASGQAWGTWTDEDGKFSFPGLPAGRYRLEAKQLGFGTSEMELFFSGESATEAQLTLHVDASSAIAAEPKTKGKVAPAPAEGSAAVTGNAASDRPAERNAAPSGGQPAPGVPSAAEKAAGGSKKSKKSVKEEPLSAAGAAPDDSSLGDAASSDAFLMSGTVNRSATLGGRGSFGGVGGATGSGNPNMDTAAAGEEFPVAGQGGGKVSGKVHRSQSHHKVKQAQTTSGASSFGQGIEELWAQHRLARLSSNQPRFSFYNRYENSVWDARPYSLTQPNPPKIGHYDEKFGTHIGGPLYIPHVYDGRQRTFFFLSYELERSTQPLDYFATVPTLAERGGDFSDRGAVELFDPSSGTTGP